MQTPTAEHHTDVQRRLAELKKIMAARDLRAVLGIAGGAPGQNGFLRYFTNVELWAGRAFFIVTANEPDPLVVMWSNYGAEWAKLIGTTSRIVSTILDNQPPIVRVVKELKAAIGNGSGQKIGTLNVQSVLSLTEHTALTQGLPGVTLDPVDTAVNAVRQIKSPFEIKAMEETGQILVGALERFGEVARPGVPAWAAASESERYAKERGCFWGRSKYSLDERPYTIPTLLDRPLRRDDVILFELVYTGPLGYWHEITCLYSFGPLPDAPAKRFDTWWKAVRAAAAVAKPGNRYGAIGETADKVFTDAGYKVIGHHTPNCHTIGTDEADGITPPPPDELLKESMVLSFHPSTWLEGDLAFLISDNYQVTPEGGRVLSPLGRPYRQLKA
ncbi:MAG: M24 family metallopeptidase [bacterium]